MSTAQEKDSAFIAWKENVTPLPDGNRAPPFRRPPRPLAAQRRLDDEAVPQESLSDHTAWDAGYETGDELAYLRSGMNSTTLRKLRRGHWVIQAELDLHGLKVEEARTALVLFLAECRRHHARCVKIIHGRGLGSKNREPVLKRKAGSWLAQRDEVLAFCQARAADGGAGAVIVLLKPGR